MHLSDILSKAARRAETSVPDWMIGCFKRRSIAFANGLTDTKTDVFWLQSRNITIDLRLPVNSERLPARQLTAYSAAELRQLANHEGWYAESLWQDDMLSWSGGTALQLHNRWPEPAILKRIGDCMMEFAPGGTYVEDWRLLSRVPGPLIGMRMMDETDLDTGQIRHRDGALIINGNYAGLVLGRSKSLESEDGAQLRDRIGGERISQDLLEAAFNFETSVARGNLTEGFRTEHSTVPGREGEMLFSLEGFAWDSEKEILIHTIKEAGTRKQRRFTIETLESEFNYCPVTEFAEEAKRWFNSEQETLGRYLKPITDEP